MVATARDYRILLTPQKAKDAERIARLKTIPGTVIVDELPSQFEELYKIRHPQTIYKPWTADNLEKFTVKITGKKPLAHFGTWCWYPWNKTLIHFLPEPLHLELRTARNRNLITKSEQRRFYGAHIGVAGLSVGNAVVSILVHTGGGKYLRIADSDVMSGSNTNRIRAGFDTVGTAKTTVIAREVLLTDPYTDLRVFTEGLTEKNLDRFLTYPVPLTVVVDEMDNLYLKIRLRLLARKHRIPVVMAADNGEGVVVDIERYDLHPNLPLMHGDVPEAELLTIRPDTPRAVAARIISTWVKPENIAERMMLSLLELGKSIYTWPQLGNAAAMAGSVMSYVVRQIAVQNPLIEGKVVVSPETLFVPPHLYAYQQKRREKIYKKFLMTMKK